MARGTESKNIITTKLLETFAGSFIYDKNKLVLHKQTYWSGNNNYENGTILIILLI